MNCLNTLSTDHRSVAVSGFENDRVLSSRRYGGCAILWRKALFLTATPIFTHSRRICAMLFNGNGFSFLCICVYMPFEKDSNSVDEFQGQLSIIDSVVSQYPNSHVILGGDFNVNLSRNWCNTRLLNDYCRQPCMFHVFRHEHSTVDYTHHFNMKYFNNHFIVSEQLYQAAILKQFVLHDVDNTSDHDPICIHVALDVAHMSACYTP